ncbi:MAG: MFS transporter [Chloroflexi bacterium]|nr:MFS transporter [Chloroflexota bacterium]
MAGSLGRARSTVNPTVLFAFLLSGGFWMTTLGINYIIPLRIQEMAVPERVPLFTGLAASIFAATMFAGVLLASRLADRWGYRQVLFAGILGMVVLFLPQGFTGELSLFMWTRALQGFCAGLINPLGRTLIAFASDPADRGTVYGISGLFMGTGAAMGPLVFGSLFTPWLGVGPAIGLMAACLVPALLLLLRRSEINVLAARG